MTQFYSINCKSHLHVGSGDSNYGVIDKLIQRDPSNQTPCIFSSSLKGAFREYFEEFKEADQVEKIFGKDTKGKIIFHQAYLLSIPVRSNQFPYFNLTAPFVIDELINQLGLFGNSDFSELIARLAEFKAAKQDGKVVIFNTRKDNLKIEEFEEADIVNNVTVSIAQSLAGLFGERLAIVDDSDFLDMSSDFRLPVIARNNLENGQSKNLWYEQIIPRSSRFFFAVSDIQGEPCEEFYTEFNKPKMVQIGANATIGYGVCLISKF